MVLGPINPVPGPPLGPIQVIPPGLVGYLNLKQFGRLPDVLSSTVDPSLEMRDWYFQANVLYTVQLCGATPITPNFVTAGVDFFRFQVGGVDFAVPKGQAWYVDLASADAALAAAGDTMQACLVKQDASKTSILQLGPVQPDVVSARAGRLLTVRSDRAFWMFPGEFFGIQLMDQVFVTNTFFSLSVRATLLPI
jgi:hypothetical protein